MFLMRADPLRGQVGGGWALEIETFLGPEMATSEASAVWTLYIVPIYVPEIGNFSNGIWVPDFLTKDRVLPEKSKRSWFSNTKIKEGYLPNFSFFGVIGVSLSQIKLPVSVFH
jgi:hypothetical protein